MTAGSAIKTYPPRGPLQLVRLSTAVTFRCVRCGLEKTAKLRAIYGGRDDNLLCNACYGFLLSVYAVKSGTDSDDVRAEKLAKLLLELVVPERHEQGGSARAMVAYSIPPPPPPPPLCVEAERFARTASQVAHLLEGGVDLDWSVAVLGLCKAFEIEVIRRLVEPLRQRLHEADLSLDLDNPDTKELALYVSGRSQRLPALGTIAFTFGRAGLVSQPSVLLEEIREFRHQESAWLINIQGFSASVLDLTRRFRNPAVHLDTLSRHDYEACHEMILGWSGLMWSLVRATSPNSF